MSSYIVENKTINRIVNYLSNGKNMEFHQRQILEKYNIDLKTTNGKHLFGLKLLDLNTSGTCQRYNKPKNTAVLADYRYEILIVSRTSALMSLSCLHYQCAEGDLFEDSFYNYLHKLKGDIALNIVSDTEEWKKLQWE